MDEAARLLTLLALAGGAVTLAGGAFVWFLDEERRIRRSLAKVMGVAPEALLTARGRGKGIGFDFSGDAVAVAWDFGAWCLLYAGQELLGVELVVDRQVAARAHRAGYAKPLDHLAEPQELVRLRFLFDDPRYPDFEIDLWRPEDEGRRGRRDAAEALHEANRWLARIDALLRRVGLARAPARVAAPAGVLPWGDEEGDAVEATIT